MEGVPNNHRWARTQNGLLAKPSRASRAVDIGAQRDGAHLGKSKGESRAEHSLGQLPVSTSESTFLVDYAPGIQHIFIRQKFEYDLYAPLQLLFTLNSLFFFNGKVIHTHGKDVGRLWCWKRLSRVPQTAGRCNQSILKEINPEYSSEGLMLKLQYSGHLMQRTDSLEKILMLGKTEGRRRRR